jgi:molybdopterin converting factor small subunit
MPATVRIDLFATARVAAGRSQIDWPVPSGGALLRVVLEEVGRAHPELRGILKVSRVARDDEYLRPGTATIRPGDRLAIHPPFSGG